MSNQLQWIEPENYPRLANVRMRCYSPSTDRYSKYIDELSGPNSLVKPGDAVIATRNGVDVGTATSLQLSMWVRGARLSCQGVAYVGTIKTHRRLGNASGGGETGVATQIMHAILERGRERSCAISALMPFRASFYEHFGYGNAERLTAWTVPLAILPRSRSDNFRFFDPDQDHGLIHDLRSREVRAGQCDVETTPQMLANWASAWSGGMVFIDHAPGGAARSYAFVTEDRKPEAATLQVQEWGCESPDALASMLTFFSSLRDQYSSMTITLPGDLPLNRLLRETQVPHRQVDHPFALPRPFTRMQIRILDHRTVLEALQLPGHIKGKCSVAIGESEGTVTRLALDFEGGRIRVSTGPADCDIECSDVVWASLVSGDLAASLAHRFDRFRVHTPEAVTLLESLSAGPAPFCQEYF
jgi:predicted acetyltransferase